MRLLLYLSCFAHLAVHTAVHACSENEYYTMKFCSTPFEIRDYTWGCRQIAPGSNIVKFCSFSAPVAAICQPQKCSLIDPYPDTCLDETIVCNKGFYAANPGFLCGPNNIFGTNYIYSGNNGMKPFIEDSFRCLPCPPGFFCRGGALLGTFSDPPLPWKHRMPSKCPFANMVARTDILQTTQYVDPCGSNAFDPSYDSCNEDQELFGICVNQTESCPCQCNVANNSRAVLLHNDPTVPEGRSCGCMPGTYWDTTLSASLVRCSNCGMNAFCPGTAASPQGCIALWIN